MHVHFFLFSSVNLAEEQIPIDSQRYPLTKYKNVEVCEKVMLLYVVVSLFNFTAFLKEKLKCPRLKLDRKLIVIATVIMIITKKTPQVLLQKSITIKIVLAWIKY